MLPSEEGKALKCVTEDKERSRKKSDIENIVDLAEHKGLIYRRPAEKRSLRIN